MNPTGVELPAEVTNARARAQELTGAAGQYSAAEPTISDLLRQKVQQAYADNQDIVAPLDEATTNYISAPSEARSQYENIFNPFQREALVSRYTANQALPMLSLSNIYGNRMGRIDDTIGAGTRAFQAAAAAKAAEAQQANQLYNTLLNEYQIQQSLAQANKPQTTIIESGGRQLLIDSQTGKTIQDLGPVQTSSGGGDGVLTRLFSDILAGNLGTPRYTVEPVQESSTKKMSTQNNMSISPMIDSAIRNVVSRR